VNGKTNKRLNGTARTLGLVNIGLVTFLVMLVLMPPVQQAAATGPVVSVPPGETPTPVIHDKYCLFPGQGNHYGFGNGFGRAGERFLCLVTNGLL